MTISNSYRACKNPPLRVGGGLGRIFHCILLEITQSWVCGLFQCCWVWLTRKRREVALWLHSRTWMIGSSLRVGEKVSWNRLTKISKVHTNFHLICLFFSCHRQIILPCGRSRRNEPTNTIRTTEHPSICRFLGQRKRHLKIPCGIWCQADNLYPKHRTFFQGRDLLSD